MSATGCAARCRPAADREEASRLYVCICHAVTTDEVRAEIAAGARTEEEVGERCMAGTGCGSCVDRICGMLRAMGVEQGQPAPLPAG